MALSIDQRAGFTVTGSATSSHSFTCNFASPLIVAICVQVRDVTGVTYNGVAMTKLQDLVSVGGGAYRTTLWGLKSPATGANTLAVTLATSDDFAIYAISTQGGDTTTGWRTSFNWDDSQGTGPNITVTNSQNGDIVFNAATVLASTIAFQNSQVTTSTTNNNVAGDGFSAGLGTLAATGANTVVSCTNQTLFSQAAVAVIPASGATAQVPVFLLHESGRYNNRHRQTECEEWRRGDRIFVSRHVYDGELLVKAA